MVGPEPLRGWVAAARWGLVGVLVVTGLAVGVAGSFVHRAAGPGGIALAVAAAVGLMLLARAVARSRWGLGLVGLAWLAPVALFSGSPAAGDIVLAADPVGLTFLFGGVGAISIVVGLGPTRVPATVPERRRVG